MTSSKRSISKRPASRNISSAKNRKSSRALISGSEIKLSGTTIEKLHQIIPKIKSVFAIESAVLKINNNPIMIVGDIHDDYSALNYILQKQKAHGCKTIVFLGDYVDRGTQGPEVLLKLFQLKIKDPKHVVILRGNHEDINMNVNYGFFNEIDRNEELQWALDEVYRKMPIAAVLSQYAFCVHGGITHPESISCINKKNAFQYMWNDPVENETGIRPSQRGSIVREFGPDVVREFLHMNNLDVIIRGHTALMPGYAWLFDRQLLSLFSCPNYCDSGNRAAYAILNDGEIRVFDYKNTGRIKKSS